MEEYIIDEIIKYLEDKISFHTLNFESHKAQEYEDALGEVKLVAGR